MRKKTDILLILICILGVLISLLKIGFDFKRNEYNQIPLEFANILLYSGMYFAFNPIRRINLILFLLLVIFNVGKIYYQYNLNIEVKIYLEIFFLATIYFLGMSVITLCYLPVLKILNYFFIKNTKYSLGMISEAYNYKHYQEVIKLGTQLVRSGVTSDKINYLIASAYFCNNDYEKSLNSYAKLSKGNFYIEAKSKYSSIICYEISDFQKSVNHATTYLKLKKDDIDILFIRADSYEEMNEYDKSIDDYTRIIELDSNISTAFYRRGRIFNLVRKYSECKKDLYCAIECTDPIPDSFIELGNIEFEDGNYEQAEKYYKIGLSFDSSLKKYIKRDQ